MSSKKTTKKAEPKLKQFEVVAVIPTGQYANIQPKLIYESEDFEQAYAAAMPHIEKISQQYAEEGKALVSTGPVASAPMSTAVNREILKCYLTGAELHYDDLGHTYVDNNDEQYISGSVWKEQFMYEFNKGMILPKYAKKYDVPEWKIEDLWRAKADCSTTFGTALHQALETYGRFSELNELLGKESGIHPTLLPIVEEFFAERGDEQAVYEPFVADVRNKRCGRIDRLVITGPKECIIEDYKTNADLYKKGTPPNLKPPYSHLPNVPISGYILQLSFYKAIVEAAGWTVKGIRVHHWNGAWETIDLKPVDIDMPQSRIDLSLIT